MASSSDSSLDLDISVQTERVRNTLEQALALHKDATWQLDLLLNKLTAAEQCDGTVHTDRKTKALMLLYNKQDREFRQLWSQYEKATERWGRNGGKQVCSLGLDELKLLGTARLNMGPQAPVSTPIASSSKKRKASRDALVPIQPDSSSTFSNRPSNLFSSRPVPGCKTDPFLVDDDENSAPIISLGHVKNSPDTKPSILNDDVFSPRKRVKIERSPSVLPKEEYHYIPHDEEVKGLNNDISFEPVENSKPSNDDVSSPRKQVKMELSHSELANEVSDDAFGASSKRKPFKWKPLKKFKKGDLVIEKSALHRRFDQLGRFPLEVKLDPGLQNFHVTRQFMASEYGGSAIKLLPNIRTSKETEHGYNDFMYPNFNYNPYLPQYPGEHGLLFRVDDGTHVWETDGNWHVENRRPIQRVLVQDKPKTFRYLGQYQLIRMEDLSKEEWMAQSQTVRNTWVAKSSLEKTRMLPVLARVYLRNIHNREPTVEEVSEQIQDKKTKLVDLVTSEAVNSAFENGQERLVIWGMKCVLYDYDFLQQLVEKYPKWVEEQEKKKKPKEKEIRPNTRVRKPSMRAKGRAFQWVNDSSDESDMAEAPSFDEVEPDLREGNDDDPDYNP